MITSKKSHPVTFHLLHQRHQKPQNQQGELTYEQFTKK